MAEGFDKQPPPRKETGEDQVAQVEGEVREAIADITQATQELTRAVEEKRVAVQKIREASNRIKDRIHTFTDRMALLIVGMLTVPPLYLKLEVWMSQEARQMVEELGRNVSQGSLERLARFSDPEKIAEFERLIREASVVPLVAMVGLLTVGHALRKIWESREMAKLR